MTWTCPNCQRQNRLELVRCEHCQIDEPPVDLAAALAAEREARVKAEKERDAAVEELADVYDSTRDTMAEECQTDEKHCTCVPHLRRGTDELRGQVKALREVVAPLLRLAMEGRVDCPSVRLNSLGPPEIQKAQALLDATGGG